MVLDTVQLINLAKQMASTPIGTPIVAVAIANAQHIDHENIPIGKIRKIRRIKIENLDNNVKEVQLVSTGASVGIVGAASVAPRVDLNKKYQLLNFGTYIDEPEEPTEFVVNVRGVNAGARRISAYVNAGAIVTGVLIDIDYVDDLD